MKQSIPMSTWVRLAVLTLLFALSGYLSTFGTLIAALAGGPVIVVLAFLLLPSLFMIFLSALLIRDWKTWAISLILQGIVYLGLGIPFQIPVLSPLGTILMNSLSLPNWTLIFITLPEFAALQALGFGIKCLLRRRKAKRSTHDHAPMEGESV